MRPRSLAFALVLLTPLAAFAAKPVAENPYVFTDQPVTIRLESAPATVDYTVRTITPAGWGKESKGTLAFKDDLAQLTPLAEAIHIVTLDTKPPATVRFLAITPPPPVDAAAVSKHVPSTRKLFAKEPYRIMAIGDSVTKTGDYHAILALMLSRAANNPNVTVAVRAYPGCSIDASVRTFARDAASAKPDLAIINYGLNDQGGHCSLDGYLDQALWLAKHLEGDFLADTVFLTPTPDLSTGPGQTSYGNYLFRTIGFGHALLDLGRECNISTGDAFTYMWGDGAPSVNDAGKGLWTCFPLGTGNQFTAMLEKEGKGGDTIHPNSLGHLAMARAAFDAIMGLTPPVPPLDIRATSRWTDAGMVSDVTVTNRSGARRQGKLTVYPLDDQAVQIKDAPNSDFSYVLDKDQSATLTLAWPHIKKAEDLLAYPYSFYHTVGPQRFVAIDYVGNTGRIYCPAAPMKSNIRFERVRMIVDDPKVVVPLSIEPASEVTVNIPDNAEVGRIPLVFPPNMDIAELVYVRYGLARIGEATVDGKLDEWTDATWLPLGEKVQARDRKGPADNRKDINEFYVSWSIKAGKDGLYFAGKITGDAGKDSFIFFFDPREPKDLGTPGPYYWASGSLGKDGKASLDKGETSPPDTRGLTGAWQATASGATVEYFIPYKLFEKDAWPVDGDLGLSIWWSHKHPDGKTTELRWSEDGHPWNTRWHGVVRLDKDGKTPRPYMVRIK